MFDCLSSALFKNCILNGDTYFAFFQYFFSPFAHKSTFDFFHSNTFYSHIKFLANTMITCLV